jgi:hypothetical protein
MRSQPQASRSACEAMKLSNCNLAGSPNTLKIAAMSCACLGAIALEKIEQQLAVEVEFVMLFILSIDSY